MNGKRLTNEAFLARYEVMADENKQLRKQNAEMTEALEKAPLAPMLLNYHSQDRIDDWFARYKIWQIDILAKALAQI